MAQTINGVTADELIEGFEEGASRSGLVAQKAYVCDWDSRYGLANGLLGLASGAGGVGGSISLAQPHAYPDSPNLYALEVSIRGKGKCTQGAKQQRWEKAIVTAKYGVPEYQTAAGDDPGGMHSIDPASPYVYCTQEMEFGGEYVTIPASALKFSDGTVIKQDQSLFIATVELSITLQKLPWLPAATILANINKLNNASFLGCATGKLRFDGAKTQRTSSTDGTRTQEVHYKFTYRPVADWNRSYHPNGTSGWVEVQDKNSSPLLSYADLSALIPSAYRA